MTRPFDMDFPRLMFLHSPKMFPTMFIPRYVNRDIIQGDGPFCWSPVALTSRRESESEEGSRKMCLKVTRIKF